MAGHETSSIDAMPSECKELIDDEITQKDRHLIIELSEKVLDKRSSGQTGGIASESIQIGTIEKGANVYNIVINKNKTKKPDGENWDNIVSVMEKKKSLFTKGTSFQTAKTVLEEKQVVLITGAPEEGKTTLALELCDYFRRHKKYKVIYYRHSDMWKIVENDKSIIVVDNMFEKLRYSQGGEEAEVLHEIKAQLANSSHDKTMFIIVSQLFNVRRADDTLKSTLLKGEYVVDISEINCSVSEERINERLGILESLSLCLKHPDKNKIADCKPFFNGFPGICAYYSTNNQTSFSERVCYPIRYFIDQIKHITESDRIKAGLFIFLVYCEGKVDMSDLSKDVLQKKLKLVTNVLGKISEKQLQNEAHYFIGSYLRYVDSKVVKFRDQVLYEACVAVSTVYYPECFFRHCQVIFRDDDDIERDNEDEDTANTITHEERKESKEIDLVIPKSYASIIMENVIDLVKSRHFTEALKNTLLQFPEYINDFVQMLEREVFQSKDISSEEHFLFCCAASGNQLLTSSVLNHPAVTISDVNETITDCIDMDSIPGLENLEAAVKESKRKEEDFNVNFRDEAGRTPLMHASMADRPNMVHHFLKKGAHSSVTDNNKHNCAHLAVAKDNFEVYQVLLKVDKQEFLKAKDCNGFTPKMIAYKKKGRIYEYLRTEVKRSRVEANEVNSTAVRYTPISSSENLNPEDVILAIMTNDVSEVECVLPKGLNVNFKFDDGDTILMKAAYHGCDIVFVHLVNKGWSLSGENVHKCNVLHVACTEGNTNIVKCILSKNIVDIDSRNISGRTPVMEATEMGHGRVFDLLVSYGCDLSGRDCDGSTILHLACAGGCREIVDYVLSHKFADVNSRDCNGKLALGIAKQWHWDKKMIDNIKGMSIEASGRRTPSGRMTQSRSFRGIVSFVLEAVDGSFIEIENNTSGAQSKVQNLHGWTMKRSSPGKPDVAFTFGDHSLKPGAKLRVYARGAAPQKGVNVGCDWLVNEDCYSWGGGSGTTIICDENKTEKACLTSTLSNMK